MLTIGSSQYIFSKILEQSIILLTNSNTNIMKRRFGYGEKIIGQTFSVKALYGLVIVNIFNVCPYDLTILGNTYYLLNLYKYMKNTCLISNTKNSI